MCMTNDRSFVRSILDGGLVLLGLLPAVSHAQEAETVSAQVVVTALGVEREKSRLGTAVQQINAGELNDTRAQNLVQQIQGKVSGVQITAPGTQGGSTNIIIRGQNSITQNNQPLFIVDGVPVSNANRGGDRASGFDYANV